MSRKERQRTEFRHYNAINNVVLIGSYPRRRDRSVRDLNAVASYVDHLAAHLNTALASANRRLIILAEHLPGEQTAYEEGQILVLRCWRKNSQFVFGQIIWTLITRLPTVKRILVQFEFNMFGGVTTTGFLPVFLLVPRLLGRSTSIMIHQVVDDLADIQAHVGLSGKRLQLEVLGRLLKLFYWLLLSTARCVAVHDDVLKERLLRIRRRHVVVIPHGSGEYQTKCDYVEARQQLGFEPGEFVMLCFGFLAHYKGSDWMVKEVVAHAKEHPGTRLRLVIAGGESPNHTGTPHYTAFFAEVLRAAAACPKRIEVTGYVPDERVPLYFTAADVAVFPYRIQLAASGPLAIALSFGCPIMISNALKSVLRSEDFRHALRENGLTDEEITFDLRAGEVTSKAMTLSRDPFRLKAMRRMALSVAAARNWSGVARDYVNLIDG